jgi:hypothetical protein
MPETEVIAKAKVQITVEVCTSTWGKGCPVEQVFEQASREAEATVTRMIANQPSARIVGKPKVMAIIGEREI